MKKKSITPIRYFLYLFPKKLVFIFFTCLLINTYAQTPLNDFNWSLNTGLSDEFTGSTLDCSKWRYIDLFGTPSPPCTVDNCCNFGGNSRFRHTNVSVGGGELVLQVDAPTGDYPYDFSECCFTGGIKSLAESYHYGYYEISAKLPGFFDGSGIPHGDKFWPAFWLAHVEFDPSDPDCRTVHDEIDILEPSGSQYADAKTNVVGWHDELGTCAPPYSTGQNCAYKVGEATYQHSSALFANYHKYAIEWTSTSLIFYFDDVPFYEVYDDPTLIMDPLGVNIDQQLEGGNVNFYTGTPFPQHMRVQYFRYHELKYDCSTNLTILNNTDLSNYVGSAVAVKNNITFGNGTGTVSIGGAQQKIFRAVNTITVNGEFAVVLGSVCAFVPTSCD